jgi:riboflavin kinase/FMN adenylyltransferase
VADEQVLGVETYIYDFDADIYGEDIEVYLQEFRRPEQKFNSVEELQAQLMRDIANL